MVYMREGGREGGGKKSQWQLGAKWHESGNGTKAETCTV